MLMVLNDKEILICVKTFPVILVLPQIQILACLYFVSYDASQTVPYLEDRFVVFFKLVTTIFLY